jgi:thermostable 8-oxoguanine DNA glycosylase
MRWLRLTTGVRFWRTDSTPQGEKAYAVAEARFLALAAERGMTPAELDTMIWKAAQKRPGGKKNDQATR